jgi:CubicO group peptidase (beta-lactamase class C family)
MAWREDAARSLTETFGGAFDSPGVVVAAACVDEAGPNGGITVRQLATHTSGLPRLAPNMDRSTVDPANPYAGFGFERDVAAY